MQDNEMNTLINANRKDKGPILITAGGTGGHVYPGPSWLRSKNNS